MRHPNRIPSGTELGTRGQWEPRRKPGPEEGRGFADLDERRKTRYAVLGKGQSKRKKQRETGMHWITRKRSSCNRGSE